MNNPRTEELLSQIEALKEELETAQEILNSIKSGSSDAIVLRDEQGESQVYTLHRANESFLAILDAMPEAAMITDENGIILYCNRIFTTWLSESVENIISGSLEKYLELADGIPVMKLLGQAMDQQVRREGSLKSGSKRRPVQFSCTKVSSGGQVQFAIVLTDLTEQKRVKELTASTHLTRLLLEQVREAILIFDPKGKIIIHSRLSTKLFQTDVHLMPVDHILKNLRIRRNEKDGFSDASRLTARKIFKMGKPISVEAVYEDPDKKLQYYCVFSAQPLKDANGVVVGGMVKIFDVTDAMQKQMDRVLFYSISHLSTQYSNLKEFGMAVCRRLSDLWEIPGLTLQFIGEFDKKREFVHYSVEPAFNAAKAEAIVEKCSLDATALSPPLIHLPASDNKGKYSLISIRSGQKDYGFMLLKWPEFTEKTGIRIEDERLLLLREQLVLAFERILTSREQKLHSLVLSDSPYGIVLLSRDFLIIWSNRAARAFFDKIGQPCKNGQQLTKLFSPANRALKSEILHSLDKEKSWHGEIALGGTGAPSQYLDCIFRPVSYGSGPENQQILMIFKDITDHKVLEQQLFQAQKMEAVGKLAGGVAHDFNNLLTVINGYSDILLQTLPENSETFKNVAQIRRAGEKAGRLTSQLLAFSRRQVIQPKILNINQAIQDMEKMLRRLIGEDIVLETELADHLHTVKVDPGQLDQIILNLAVNARDAMPEGGVLKIKTANVNLGATYSLKKELVKPGKYVLLQVSDTGMGMTKDVLEKIFEPFFTTKEKGKGTGLGLSTVYGIVKQHNGYIWAYSEPGMGATFKIYFPVVESRVEREKTSEVEAGDLFGSETILLVEDDQWVRKFTALSLEAYGYRVLEAGDGQEALQLFEEEPDIDIVVTDLVMPHLGGHELGKRLAQKSEKLKIIYMSGYTEDAMIKYGIMKKGVNFIQKPFSGIDLVKKIKEVKEKSTQRRADNDKN